MKYLRNMIYPITLIEPGQEIQLEDGTFEKEEDIRYNVFASRRYFSGGEGIVSNTELATRQIEYMIRISGFERVNPTWSIEDGECMLRIDSVHPYNHSPRLFLIIRAEVRE